MKLFSNINKLTLFVAASALSVGALADQSSPAEFRGYSKCLEAAADDSHGLSSNRVYLLNRENDTNHYYINATRWQNGERVAVRISCQTTPNGRLLLSQNLTEGRFDTRQGQVTVEVAKR